MAQVKEFKTVRVEKDDGIAWVILNRPEKRNAMNPQMHYDLVYSSGHRRASRKQRTLSKPSGLKPPD